MGSWSLRGNASTTRNAAIRRTALLAVALGAAHLVWLISAGFGALWVSLPFLLLEIWGFVQFGLRTSLVWGAVPDQDLEQADPEHDRLVDLVITCTFQTPDELEQTLVSCRSMRGVNRKTVVLQSAEPALLAVAERFDVEIRVVEGNHVDGYWAAARLSEYALWLIAGQVAAPGCIEAMVAEFDDDSVAFVQADVGLHNTDSFAHVRGGRDEDAFHSRVVQPILGERGAATWKGGGSIVRISAVADTGGFDRNDQAALQRSAIRMQAAGRISRYSAEPIVVRGAAPDSLGAYLMLRRRSAIELLRVFRTKENPLVNKGLTPRQRIDHVALGMGFASSLRQLGLTLVLIATLFTGAVPFGGSAAVWAALWIPLQLTTIRANRLLARGTMERGDWTRQAWRTLAADLNAFTTVLGLRRTVAAFYRTSGSGFGAIDKMRLATVVLLLLDIAVAARGLTLIWPRILPRFSLSGRIMAIGLGLLVIVVIIDVLQVAVRRKQRRANFRLTTDLVAAVDDQLVHVIDLAVAGFGAELHVRECPFEVGQRVPIVLRLPANAGDEQRLEFEGEVRSIVERGDRYRLGVSFAAVPAHVRTGLISYCAVSHHELAGGYGDAHDLHPANFAVAAPRGSLVKFCSAVAMLTGIGVLLAGPAAPKALADVVAPVTVCLHTSTGESLDGGVASFQYDEEWHAIGATGLSGCIEGKLPGTKTRVEMVHRGIRAVIRQDLAANPKVEFTTTPVTVELHSADGSPLEGGVAEFRSAGEWRSFGTTNREGTVSSELLATRSNFAMTFAGVRVVQQADLHEVSRVRFETIPVTVSLEDSRGSAVTGAIAEYRGADWSRIGETSETGIASIELLPGHVRFAMNHEGGRTTIRQDLAIDSQVRFAMQSVAVEFRSVAGEPIAGAPVEVKGDGWRNIGDTNEAGSLEIDVLPQTRSFRITDDGRRQQIRQDVSVDPVIRFATVPASIQVNAADGSPLIGVPVEIRGSAWRELGGTDEFGRLDLEALPTATSFRVRYDGIAATGRWNLATDPDGTFSTQPTLVRVVGSAGEPLSGIEVEVRSVGWNTLGETDESGEVTGDFLPSRIRFRLVHDGVRETVRGDTRETPLVLFEVPTEVVVPDDESNNPETATEGSDPFGAEGPDPISAEGPDPISAEGAEGDGSTALSTPEPTDTTTTTATTVTTTTVGIDEGTGPTVAPTTTAETPSSSEASAITTTTGAPEPPLAADTATSTASPSSTTTSSAAETPTSTASPSSTTTSSAAATSSTSEITTTTEFGPARQLSTPSTSSTSASEEPPELVQAVAGRNVLAGPGKLFESEAVATALTWSSPDPDSSRLLEATLEDASIYTSFGDASTVGYLIRIDNPSTEDLLDGAVVEIQIPGASDLAPEPQEGWDCEDVGETWRCVHDDTFAAASSSTIRVAATLPAPEVVAFVPQNSTSDLVLFGGTVAGLLGLLYLGMLQVDRKRPSAQ